MAGEKLKPIDRVLEIVYSVAAVPVLLGALFKITHKAPFGDPNSWLEVGLYTEAFVFLTFGLRYLFFPPQKVDELGNAVSEEAVSTGKTTSGMAVTTTNAAFQGNANYSPQNYAARNKIDTFFEDSKLSPESLDKLSEGFKSLEATLQKLGNASSGIVETEEYAAKLKEATASLDHLNTFYGKLSEASTAIAESADDAQKTRQEMATLAGNLEKLNHIYSGMISAMQSK